jgi:hypothetical protein
MSMPDMVPTTADVTVIPTVPAGSGGLTAVIDWSLFTVKDVAGMEPKSTAVVPQLKTDPLIVTTVPPAVLPLLGLTKVITGGAAR